MINKLPQWTTKPIFHKNQTIFFVWMLSGLIYAMVKLLMGKYNNYKIFEHTFEHAVNGLSLYELYPDQYYDCNHYGILFSIVIAPFSMCPQWAGMILWILANTALLFYAIRQLPLTHEQKVIVYWYSLCELMSAQEMQQFNIAVAAIIILSFVFIERGREFWAAFFIIAGVLMKIYPIVGFAFFFFSKHKLRFVLSCVCWASILILLPVLYTPGWDYVQSQYIEWFQRLQEKNAMNAFAVSQNISLLGAVRKISGNPHYSDLWLIIPGIVLFFVSYLRISQYKYLRFRLMVLANILLFIVLFSTGTEGCGYILAMIGTAIWYICSPSKHQKYNRWLLLIALVVVGLSTTEIVPPFIRHGFILPFVLKSWPCIVIWFTICYEMIRFDFSKPMQRIDGKE